MLTDQEKIDYIYKVKFYNFKKNLALSFASNVLLLENGYLLKATGTLSYNFTKEKYVKYDYSKYKYLINLMHLFNTYLIFVTARMETKGLRLFNRYSIFYKKAKASKSRSIFVVNLTKYALLLPYSDIKIAKHIVKIYDNENRGMYK